MQLQKLGNSENVAIKTVTISYKKVLLINLVHLKMIINTVHNIARTTHQTQKHNIE